MKERMKLLKKLDKLRKQLDIVVNGDQYCNEYKLEERIKELENRLKIKNI